MSERAVSFRNVCRRGIIRVPGRSDRAHRHVRYGGAATATRSRRYWYTLVLLATALLGAGAATGTVAAAPTGQAIFAPTATAMPGLLLPPAGSVGLGGGPNDPRGSMVTPTVTATPLVVVTGALAA